MCVCVCVCGDQISYTMIMNIEWRVATLIKKETKATKLDSCSTTSDVAGVVTVRCEFSRDLSKPHPDRYRKGEYFTHNPLLFKRILMTVPIRNDGQERQQTAHQSYES